MVEDAADEQEEVKSRGKEMSRGHNRVDRLDEYDRDSDDAVPIPSAVDLSEKFHALETVCFHCNLPEDCVF